MKKNLLNYFILLAAFLIVSTNRAFCFTAVTSGAWSNAATWGGVGPGSTVSGQDIIIPAGVSVTFDMNVTFSGLVNTFSVNGTLTGSSSNQLIISQGTFAGTGTVDIYRIEFGGVASSSFSGSLMLNVLENNGTFLSLSSTTTISDSLSLEGGTLSIGTGANLEMLANSTIRRNNGTLSISGGVFNSSNSYDLWYVGSSKTTGPECNSTAVQDIYVHLMNNAQILTLGEDMRANALLDIDFARLDLNGYDLEIFGNLVLTNGAQFDSPSTSTITLQSSTTLTSGFAFAAGSACDVFHINYTGTGNVELNTELTITGELDLETGTFSLETGSQLILTSGALIRITDGNLVGNGGGFVATASYDVRFEGGTHTTGLEFTGSGLNDVTVDLNSPSNEIHFGSNAQVDGHLSLMSGLFALEGYDLSLDGTLDQWPNASLKGSVGSEIAFNITCPSNDTIWFDPSYQTLDKVTINITGSGDLVLKSKLIISNELSLINGKIDISQYDLVIVNGGIITSYSDVSYVNTSSWGRLQQYISTGAPYKVFPVGSDINYSPCSIQQAAGGTSGNFMVNVYNGVYSSGTVGQDLTISGALVDRTWRVESDPGFTYNMNLKTGWMLASEVNGFDRTNCYISHYMGSWDTYAAGSAAVGLNNTYEMERTGITSLSPFAVTDANTGLSVDEIGKETSFLIYPNPVAGMLNLGINGNANNYAFEVIDLSGRVFIVEPAGTNQLDVSFLESGSYLLRVIDNASREIATSRFIKI
jgi:hypothetical protein